MTKLSGSWCGRDLVTKDIYGKRGCEVFAMKLVAYEKKFGFIRTQLQLVLYIQF